MRVPTGMIASAVALCPWPGSAQTRVDIEIPPAAEYVEGEIVDTYGTTRFRTASPWIILPEGAQLKGVEARDARGRAVKEGAHVRPHHVEPAPPPAAPAPPPAPAPAPAAQPTPEAADLSQSEEPQADEPSRPVVQIVDYHADWSRFLLIGVGVGVSREAVTAKGGVSRYETGYGSFPVHLEVTKARVPGDSWTAGLRFEHKSIEEKLQVSDDTAGDKTSRSERRTRQRQTIFGHFRVLEASAWSLHLGPTLSFQHVDAIATDDAEQGTGAMRRMFQRRVGADALARYAIRDGAQIQAALSVEPNLGKPAKGLWLNAALEGELAVGNEVWIFAQGSYARWTWRTELSCPAAATGCRKDGETTGAANELRLGIRLNTYIP